ncbi:hypothetical protein LR004_01035 [Candidatus Gracilibacteria bacterium]|nr:hypothetical protein [Candidatus Gracilibacteria bacterium]
MKIVLFIILLVLALSSFYKINSLNYTKIKQINQSIVNHPENLPTKETAKNSTFGFANLRADLYWLQTIQYIGGNAISSDYKRYLYTMLDLITELNPYFEHPYVIGELLLPSYNERYEDLSQEEQDINTQEAIMIGEKGIKNFCDPEKLELVKNEFNLNKLWTEEKYKDTCKDADIAFKLAFIYQYYLHDGLSASYYYKVASVSENALEGAKVMTAIMQGKGGDREKSFFMFLNMASTVEQNDAVCIDFANQLNALALNGQLKNDTQTIKKIEEMRNQIFPQNTDDENDSLNDAECSGFLNKAIRELNLSYIEAGHDEYMKTHTEPLYNAKELFDKGFIDFLPTDHQQGEDYGIIYTYNDDIGHFDYEMGKY